jgi:hypothetical protein
MLLPTGLPKVEGFPPVFVRRAKEATMTGKILTINFKYSVTGSEYQQAVSSLAADFAAIPGLRWKIWTINDEESEAGGVYLFDGAASLQAFLGSELAAQVTSHPALSEFSVKQFDIMPAETALARGPV